MLIIILAHLPIFTLQRHEGRIFAPMAYTITSALIGSLLFNLQPRDPLTIAGAAIVLIAVGMAAGWIPARRASRVDPTLALK